MAGEDVTVWWVDHHFGMHPPTLESAPGVKTTKQVRYRDRYSMNHVPVERATFTARDAIARYRKLWTHELELAKEQVGTIERALTTVDEIEQGLA